MIRKPVFIFGAPLDSYFIFVILAGAAVAIGLWWFLKYTRYGHIVKAAVYSREMVAALGIPIPRIDTWVFTLGIFLAGFAGAYRRLSAPSRWAWIPPSSSRPFAWW